jgi:tripartite-type tricarboxylate transporter receptor subunit TctC
MRAGSSRLAVSAPARLATAPQVPTLKEAGIDYVRYGWLGICAAQGTPQPVIDRLNREIATVVAGADYKSMIENAGSIAVASTPEELAQVIAQTFDDVAATIRDYGLQQEP